VTGGWVAGGCVAGCPVGDAGAQAAKAIAITTIPKSKRFISISPQKIANCLIFE
jgi:hypothetical protein